MKLKVKISVIGAMLLISFLAWGKLSSLAGDQKVSYTPSKKECLSVDHSVPWKYCVHTPADGKVNGNVAYLLHGRNLDENTWNDDTFYTSMIQKYWTEHGLIPPTVVTVSFGPVWLITPRGKLPQSGLLEIFTGEVMPEIENRIGKPSSRIVFGESMGGLNSLTLGLSTGHLFQRVASLCPAVYLGSPFDSVMQIKAFVERTGADPKITFGIRQLAKQFVADETEWQAISPTQLVERANPHESPELYLSCGLYDNYGNFEGNQHFADRAAQRGFQISWRPIYGGHCAIDIPSLAEFLARK